MFLTFPVEFHMDKIFYINRSWWESSVTVSSAVVSIVEEMEASDPFVFVTCCLLAVSVLTHSFSEFIIKEKNVLELVFSPESLKMQHT